MSIRQMGEWTEGREYWLEYVRVNGYAWQPSRSGLQKLSRLLDLEVSYLSRRINFYLEN